MFPAKAKRVIFLFMHGGPSQVDTFDPKPLLTRDNGKPLPFAKPRVQFAQTGNLLESPWEFKKYGQSGIEVSDLFPHVATHASTISAWSARCTATTRPTAARCWRCTPAPTRWSGPSMGSWITYGLGTENQNLPGFITICPTLGHGGVQNWSSAFLPAAYQGTPIGNASIPGQRRADQLHQEPGDIRRPAADAARHAARA